ncbi:MAG TPA: SRPBCC domain-containing protein [Vicinamibacterales bacterium]|nr:SRPBCC domain-containing protein [Vicinamibacterales bacterium]
MTGTQQPIVLDRTYRATLEELWNLWTTKDGFESWWGPEGFRVEVQTIDARPGGTLTYDMIADAPEAIEAMRRMGQPISHRTTGTFSEVIRHTRIALTHLIDFVAGVAPYDSTAVVEFAPSGDAVRMIVTLSPLHDEQWTRNATMGWTSQLTKLEGILSSQFTKERR